MNAEIDVDEHITLVINKYKVTDNKIIESTNNK